LFWRWLPYKYIIRRLARSQGLLDPLTLFSQIGKLAQPSEVDVPVELLRAALVFHARGVLNARTIQNNLDWLWPYWVQRQFDPLGPDFVPRSLSVSHVNITHRNWTAVGLPGCAAYPIVDPCGMVTPFYDGWSIEGWLLTPSGKALLPSRCAAPAQRLLLDDGGLRIETALEAEGLRMVSTVDVGLRGETPRCRIRYDLTVEERAFFVAALRPFNPEGVSFVETACLGDDRRTWIINGLDCLAFGRRADRHAVSTYAEGDVFIRLLEREERSRVSCDVGLATAAALWEVEPGRTEPLLVEVDLTRDPETRTLFPAPGTAETWHEALAGICRLWVPDERVRFLYDAAVRAVVLHAPLEVYPGPFYYKRFWFRDAVLILHPMLAIGLHDRVERVMDTFPSRQTMGGYFRSQEGEWDSNGQVLWLMRRYADLSGRPCKEAWVEALVKAGDWIRRKRLEDDSEAIHAGLLPPGFSCEHLGNNDYYYWDDLWGVAGLEAAADICRRHGLEREAERFRGEAARFMGAVERSLRRSEPVRRHPGIPASPHRRMDSGAVGSIIGGYPLQLWPARDERLLATVDFLLDRCFIDRAFFQDLSHSGLNIYLSLHCAQVLLRAGDPRWEAIIRRVAELASPTGQWPEAIHPQTLSGCMGDGQHMWAAAEWVMMLRNAFVREEGDTLVLLEGLSRDWLTGSEPAEMGPVHTPFGPVTVLASAEGNRLRVSWEADWRRPPEEMVVAPLGLREGVAGPGSRGELVLPLPPVPSPGPAGGGPGEP
jgi:hypothetical protein